MQRRAHKFRVEYRPIPDRIRKVFQVMFVKKQKPVNIFVIADMELNTRNQAVFNRDAMTLRGHHITINALMREVNKLRVARGHPQVLYSPLWEVKA